MNEFTRQSPFFQKNSSICSVNNEGLYSEVSVGDFNNNLEAYIFASWYEKKFNDKTLVRANSSVKAEKQELLSLVPSPFKNFECHFPNNYSSFKEKMSIIKKWNREVKKGTKTIKEFEDYLSDLPSTGGAKGFGYTRLAYLYLSIDREKAGTLFKMLADYEFDIHEYDRIDSMRNYARHLHYYVEDETMQKLSVNYQQILAQRNYQSYLAYLAIKQYIKESPKSKKMSEYFLPLINKELTAILLERARCDKVSFEEVRNEAATLLDELPGNCVETKQYIQLMSLETYAFANDSKSLIKKAEAFIEKETEKDTLPYETVEYWRAWGYYKQGKYEIAEPLFDSIISKKSEKSYKTFNPRIFAFIKKYKMADNKKNTKKSKEILSSFRTEYPSFFDDTIVSIDDSSEKVLEHFNQRLSQLDLSNIHANTAGE